MKWLGLVLALAPASASAASLPITDGYCDEGETSVGPDGFSIEESTCAVDDASEAPRFHFVCEGGDAFYATVIEDPAKGTLTFTAEQNTDWTTTESMVLRRCRDMW
jgi:hypothetical protein